MNTILSHSGNMGDLFYAFPFIEELSEKIKSTITLHIHTNVRNPNFILKDIHPNGDIGFTKKNVDFMLPLLKKIPFIKKVTYGDELPADAEAKILDLSIFRKLPLNFQAGDGQEWYYNLIGEHLPQDFSKQRISVEPDYMFRDKILIVNSVRYNNMFLDLKALEDFKDKLVFVGLESEHKEFEKKAFNVSFFKVQDALHFARILRGSKGIVSNQNGLFSIAEQMKVPRILMSPEYMKVKDNLFPGPHNVILNGGWHETAQITQKLKSAVQNLLDK